MCRFFASIRRFPVYGMVSAIAVVLACSPCLQAQSVESAGDPWFGLQTRVESIERDVAEVKAGQADLGRMVGSLAESVYALDQKLDVLAEALADDPEPAPTPTPATTAEPTADGMTAAEIRAMWRDCPDCRDYAEGLLAELGGASWASSEVASLRSASPATKQVWQTVQVCGPGGCTTQQRLVTVAADCTCENCQCGSAAGVASSPAAGSSGGRFGLVRGQPARNFGRLGLRVLTAPFRLFRCR